MKIIHPINENTCYVAHQGLGNLYDMFNQQRVDVIFYPENSLTSLERRIGVRYQKSIVTESAQMICMYDKKDVYIWRDGQWVNPESQTFGCSFEIIESNVLLFDNSISVSILSNDRVEKMRTEIKNLYK
jgi:hypothetical protein